MASSLTKFAIALFAIPILFGMELTVGMNPVVNEYVTDGEKLTAVVVDLQELRQDERYLSVRLPFGSGYQFFIVPFTGHVISGIISGNSEVYMCDSSRGESVNVIEVFYHEEEAFLEACIGEERLRFGQVGEVFVRLTPTEYHYRLTRMGRSYTLDVSETEDTEEVDVVTQNLFERDTLVYKPRYGTKVDKLVDGEITVWKDCSGDDVITEVMATSFSDEEKVLFLTIDNHQETKVQCYIGEGDGYYPMSFEEYFRCVLYGEDFFQTILQTKKEEMLEGAAFLG
ncbi:hypothetical protein BgAZ_200830 [Babesia gibsoni]|uniref:Uncharacterized protein n=1 Tax=Babesia gibsoni TaxID=33632 RepID=A0AAD8PE39_BABGI|nr:hypothetical protein BgAZ_200830 [Babesia gibsoni]